MSSSILLRIPSDVMENTISSFLLMEEKKCILQRVSKAVKYLFQDYACFRMHESFVFRESIIPTYFLEQMKVKEIKINNKSWNQFVARLAFSIETLCLSLNENDIDDDVWLMSLMRLQKLYLCQSMRDAYGCCCRFAAGSTLTHIIIGESLIVRWNSLSVLYSFPNLIYYDLKDARLSLSEGDEKVMSVETLQSFPFFQQMLVWHMNDTELQSNPNMFRQIFGPTSLKSLSFSFRDVYPEYFENFETEVVHPFSYMTSLNSLSIDDDRYLTHKLFRTLSERGVTPNIPLRTLKLRQMRMQRRMPDEWTCSDFFGSILPQLENFCWEFARRDQDCLDLWRLICQRGTKLKRLSLTNFASCIDESDYNWVYSLTNWHVDPLICLTSLELREYAFSEMSELPFFFKCTPNLLTLEIDIPYEEAGPAVLNLIAYCLPSLQSLTCTSNWKETQSSLYLYRTEEWQTYYQEMQKNIRGKSIPFPSLQILKLEGGTWRKLVEIKPELIFPRLRLLSLPSYFDDSNSDLNLLLMWSTLSCLESLILFNNCNCDCEICHLLRLHTYTHHSEILSSVFLDVKKKEEYDDLDTSSSSIFVRHFHTDGGREKFFNQLFALSQERNNVI
jgi:hypothetical protein